MAVNVKILVKSQSLNEKTITSSIQKALSAAPGRDVALIKRIIVHNTPRRELAYTDFAGHTIHLYKGWLDAGDDQAMILLHELGHLVEQQSALDSWAFTLRGLGKYVKWRGISRYERHHQEGEEYAQAYAEYLLGMQRGPRMTQFWTEREHADFNNGEMQATAIPEHRMRPTRLRARM